MQQDGLLSQCLLVLHYFPNFCPKENHNRMSQISAENNCTDTQWSKQHLFFLVRSKQHLLSVPIFKNEYRAGKKNRERDLFNRKIFANRVPILR